MFLKYFYNFGTCGMKTIKDGEWSADYFGIFWSLLKRLTEYLQKSIKGL